MDSYEFLKAQMDEMNAKEAKPLNDALARIAELDAQLAGLQEAFRAGAKLEATNEALLPGGIRVSEEAVAATQFDRSAAYMQDRIAALESENAKLRAALPSPWLVELGKLAARYRRACTIDPHVNFEADIDHTERLLLDHAFNKGEEPT